MAVTITKQQDILQFNANCIGKIYNIVGDTSYQGGYTIDEDVYPDSENPFSKILAIIQIDETITENGYIPSYTKDNTSETNPSILMEVRDFPTGGGTPTEVNNGTDLSAETFKVLIVGIPLDGVICDPC